MRVQLEEEYFLKLKKYWKSFKLATHSFEIARKEGLTNIVDFYIATKWAREFRYLITFLKRYSQIDFSSILEKHPEVSEWEVETSQFEASYKEEFNKTSSKERLMVIKEM